MSGVQYVALNTMGNLVQSDRKFSDSMPQVYLDEFIKELSRSSYLKMPIYQLSKHWWNECVTGERKVQYFGKYHELVDSGAIQQLYKKLKVELAPQYIVDKYVIKYYEELTRDDKVENHWSEILKTISNMPPELFEKDDNGYIKTYDSWNEAMNDRVHKEGKVVLMKGCKGF